MALRFLFSSPILAIGTDRQSVGGPRQKEILNESLQEFRSSLRSQDSDGISPGFLLPVPQLSPPWIPNLEEPITAQLPCRQDTSPQPPYESKLKAKFIPSPQALVCISTLFALPLVAFSHFGFLAQDKGSFCMEMLLPVLLAFDLHFFVVVFLLT